MSKPDFPATRFLCDVLRHKMGKMTKAELRKRWSDGEYPGVNPQWAAEQFR